MWVFFEDGTFYSAVTDEKDKSVKWVRTRDRRSAELFADYVCFERETDEVPILEWPGRDYAYRIKAAPGEWTKYVAMQAEIAGATNFKNQVKYNLRGEEHAKAFTDALSSVWSAMFGLQHELKRGKKKKKQPKFSYDTINYESLSDEELDELVIEDEGWEAYQNWLERNHNG